jgi:hypothetical protein
MSFIIFYYFPLPGYFIDECFLPLWSLFFVVFSLLWHGAVEMWAVPALFTLHGLASVARAINRISWLNLPASDASWLFDIKASELE